MGPRTRGQPGPSKKLSVQSPSVAKREPEAKSPTKKVAIEKSAECVSPSRGSGGTASKDKSITPTRSSRRHCTADLDEKVTPISSKHNRGQDGEASPRAKKVTASDKKSSPGTASEVSSLRGNGHGDEEQGPESLAGVTAATQGNDEIVAESRQSVEAAAETPKSAKEEGRTQGRQVTARKSGIDQKVTVQEKEGRDAGAGDEGNCDGEVKNAGGSAQQAEVMAIDAAAIEDSAAEKEGNEGAGKKRKAEGPGEKGGRKAVAKKPKLESVKAIRSAAGDKSVNDAASAEKAGGKGANGSAASSDAAKRKEDVVGATAMDVDKTEGEEKEAPGPGERGTAESKGREEEAEANAEELGAEVSAEGGRGARRKSSAAAAEGGGSRRGSATPRGGGAGKAARATSSTPKSTGSTPRSQPTPKGGVLGRRLSKGGSLSAPSTPRAEKRGGLSADGVEPRGEVGRGGESWFCVLVDEEWRDQKGFQLWEASSDPEHDGTVKAREWYCAAELEPKGGFEFGHQRFMPLQASCSRRQRLFGTDGQAIAPVSVSFFSVKQKGKMKQYIEIDSEQRRVKQAYDKLLPAVTPRAQHAAEGEAAEDEAASADPDAMVGWPGLEGVVLLDLVRKDWPGPAAGVPSTSVLNKAYILSEAARWCGEVAKRQPANTNLFDLHGVPKPQR